MEIDQAKSVMTLNEDFFHGENAYFYVTFLANIYPTICFTNEVIAGIDELHPGRYFVPGGIVVYANDENIFSDRFRILQTLACITKASYTKSMFYQCNLFSRIQSSMEWYKNCINTALVTLHDIPEEKNYVLHALLAYDCANADETISKSVMNRLIRVLLDDVKIIKSKEGSVALSCLLRIMRYKAQLNKKQEIRGNSSLVLEENELAKLNIALSYHHIVLFYELLSKEFVQHRFADRILFNEQKITIQASIAV